MNILVIKFRNIGDVLLVTPLLHNLKQHYPESNIDIAINHGTESMLSLNPNVNELVVYNREQIKALPIVQKLYKEAQFLLSFRKRTYDLVVNLTEGDRGAYIAQLSGALMRVGYPSKSRLLKNAFTHYLLKQDFRHTIETNLDPLRVLDIPIKSKQVEIFHHLEDQSFVDQALSETTRFIHIHPVSRWLFKCISDQTMAQIIDHCELELKTKVVLTAAPIQAELDKVDSILSLCQSNPINLSGDLSLKQIVALNKKASMFIGVDTAIMHISAANNTPVLAFFGPSGTDHWGPWDNNLPQSTYANRNGLQTMGMHRVIAESRECQPCGRDGCNGSKVSDCLMSLDLDIIKQNIQEMLLEQDN